jgi:hypothetical protein
LDKFHFEAGIAGTRKGKGRERRSLWGGLGEEVEEQGATFPIDNVWNVGLVFDVHLLDRMEKKYFTIDSRLLDG